MKNIIYITLLFVAMSFGKGFAISKSVAFLGDSNTWIGGDDCSNANAWSFHLIKNLMPTSYRSYARSGATWTNNATTLPDVRHYSEIIDDNNVIYNQCLRLIQDIDKKLFPVPDFIFISAGTNDAWFSDRRPDIWKLTPEQVKNLPLTAVSKPSDATSLAASVHLCLMMLRQHCPTSRIIIVAPPYTVKTTKKEIERVADTLQQIALLAGTGCVRIERICGIDPDLEAKSFSLTTDGTHTSQQGAWQIAKCVYNYLAFNNWIK